MIKLSNEDWKWLRKTYEAALEMETTDEVRTVENSTAYMEVCRYPTSNGKEDIVRIYFSQMIGKKD